MTPAEALAEATREPPAWCGYPAPWTPGVGCWSLLSGRIKAEVDCGDCECRVRAPLPAAQSGEKR